MSGYQLIPNSLGTKIIDQLPYLIARALMCVKQAREFGFVVSDGDLDRLYRTAPLRLHSHERLSVRLRTDEVPSTAQGHLDMIEMVCREAGLGFESSLEVGVDRLRLASPNMQYKSACEWVTIDPLNSHTRYADEILALGWLHPEYICSLRSNDVLLMRGYEYYQKPINGAAHWNHVPLIIDASSRAPGRLLVGARLRDDGGLFASRAPHSM